MSILFKSISLVNISLSVGDKNLICEWISMNWSCGLQFRFRNGPERGITYPIDSPVLKIGRSRHPGDRQKGWLYVSDDTVSKLHCELFWQEDRKCFRLLHRSTTNSTYVNGEVVEDVEVFSGDLIEVGKITLELQQADLRWTASGDRDSTQWPVRHLDATNALKGSPLTLPPTLQIPGASVPESSTSIGGKINIGPQDLYQFIDQNNTVYPLSDRRIRFGCTLESEEDEPQEQAVTQRPHFHTHHVLKGEDGIDYSPYNLILRYDELYQGYKAARIGPKAQEISISRSQGGLLWHSTFPEGVEVELAPGDQLLIGSIKLSYQKAEAN